MESLHRAQLEQNIDSRLILEKMVLPANEAMGDALEEVYLFFEVFHFDEFVSLEFELVFGGLGDLLL